MMNPYSLGSPQTDPSNQRALETLFSLISDVEQRLQIVKASISQTIPNLATPSFGTPSFGVGSPITPLGSPNFGSIQHAQFLASLGIQTPNTTQPQGVHALVQTPYGAVPVFIPTPTGVPTNSPWGSAVGMNNFGVPNVGPLPGFAGTAFGNFRL